MMNSNFKRFIKNRKCNRGFSLAELMVVLVIVGILAIGVVFMFADQTAKVKAAAFEMRGDFNLARGVAVKDNTDVIIDFDPATDSYLICFDDWDANNDAPGSDGACADSASGNDTLVKEVVFKNKVKYYDFDGTAPANGPDDDPLGNALVGKEGITFGGATTLTFRANGTCDKSGSVVVYYPKNGEPATLTVKGKPYAIVVDNANTGRVRLERWRPEKDVWDIK